MVRAYWIGLMLLALALMPVELQARTYAAIVQDYRTGEVLHSRRADTLVYPASLTKMMTLYMLFEALEDGRLNMNSKLKVSARAAGMPESKLGLRQGSTIRVEDAIKALVVKSANDVAVVVAEALAGSEIRFAIRMTERARQLGMAKTTFKNASGLPNRRQKTTARDMARLASLLVRNFQRHYHFFSMKSFRYAGRTHRSHNKLLDSYAGADGLKTGYIRASGFNLAATARRGSRRVVAIVFGGRTAASRNAEMVKLLDLGFERVGEDNWIAGLEPPPANPRRRASRLASTQGSRDPLAVVGDIGVPVSKPTVAAIEPQSGEQESVGVLALAQPPGDRQAFPTTAGRASERRAVTARELPIVRAPHRDRVALARMGEPAAGGGEARHVLQAGEPKSDAVGEYAVQVGAYHDPDRAHQLALEVIEQLPAILTAGDVHVSELRRGRRPVYRSRVIGFSRYQAERACRELRRIGQDCLVVQVDPLQLAASVVTN